EFCVVGGTGGVKSTGGERAHHQVVENFGDRLRSKHDAKFSRRGPSTVGEGKGAADGVAAQHAGGAAHRSGAIAERTGSTLGVERFDYRRDGGVEMRALVGPDFSESEIRIEDRDSIANHGYVATDDQTGVLDSRRAKAIVGGPLRECSQSAVQHVPRGSSARAVPHSRQ